VPRRLRERADGADRQGLLRGPDGGAAGRDPRRARRRRVPVPGPQNGRFASEPKAGLTSSRRAGGEAHNASVALALAIGDTVKRIDGTEVPLTTPWLGKGTSPRRRPSGPRADPHAACPAWPRRRAVPAEGSVVPENTGTALTTLRCRAPSGADDLKKIERDRSQDREASEFARLLPLRPDRELVGVRYRLGRREPRGLSWAGCAGQLDRTSEKACPREGDRRVLRGYKLARSGLALSRTWRTKHDETDPGVHGAGRGDIGRGIPRGLRGADGCRRVHLLAGAFPRGGGGGCRRGLPAHRVPPQAGSARTYAGAAARGAGAQACCRAGGAQPAPAAPPASAAPEPVARSAGQEAKPATLDAPKGGAADDLKKIKGVGPKLEAMLHGMGFYHYEQIANWTAGEVAWVDANLEGFKGRVSRDNWVEQAKVLSAGGDGWNPQRGRARCGNGDCDDARPRTRPADGAAGAHGRRGHRGDDVALDGGHSGSAARWDGRRAMSSCSTCSRWPGSCGRSS
jgi:NADH-quinone oxidoreductase subunit E